MLRRVQESVVGGNCMQDWPVQGLVEQVFGGGELGDFDGGFVREASALEDTGREGKVSSVEHELGVGRGGGLDAQVAEHGVGFQAAKQHDCLCADVGTEQGCGTAWAQGLGGDFGGEDAGVDFVHHGRMLDDVGDVGRFGWRGPVDGWAG